MNLRLSYLCPYCCLFHPISFSVCRSASFSLSLCFSLSFLSLSLFLSFSLSVYISLCISLSISLSLSLISLLISLLLTQTLFSALNRHVLTISLILFNPYQSIQRIKKCVYGYEWSPRGLQSVETHYNSSQNYCFLKYILQLWNRIPWSLSLSTTKSSKSFFSYLS